MKHPDIHLTDLISREKLDELLRVFTEATRVASIIVDPDGKPITFPHNFTPFCSKYCRSTDEGQRKCYESDCYGGTESARLKKRVIYNCLNAGLADSATPIIVEGFHMATLVCGQVRLESISTETAIENALSIGITDINGYLKALEDIPLMNREHLVAIVNLMEVIASTIGELALKQYLSYKYSRRYLHKLVNSVSDCIVSIKPDTSITMINESGTAMFGYESKEIIGKSVIDLFSDSKSINTFKKRMETNQEHGKREILNAKAKNNNIFQVQMSLARIDGENGTYGGYVAVLRDVTEERNMERMKEDLIGMLTHDMGNPILSIQRALQLLADSALGSLNKAQAEVTGLALDTSHQLLGMVTDFLDIYRDENGQFLLRKSRIDMNNVIQDSIKPVIFLAQDKNISIVFEPNSGLLEFSGDGNRLRRMCGNLLENAIRYSPEHKNIKVSCVKLFVDEKQGLKSHGFRHAPDSFIEKNSGKEYILTTISDQGPGIPKENRAAIFDKFFTTKSRKDKRRKGIGLGLAFCKLVVEAHGGLIWTQARGENKPGCRFHFILPVM